MPCAGEERPGRWSVGESAPQGHDRGIRVTWEEYLKMTAENENRYGYIDGKIVPAGFAPLPQQKAVK